MKNILNKLIIIGKSVAVFVTAFIIGVKATAATRTKTVLDCNKGESFVDTAVKILIAIIIGGLVLAGLYLLFNSTILPTLTTRIQEMFNYSGGA